MRIKLSEPILKFRPSVDLLNTLIHEYVPPFSLFLFFSSLLLIIEMLMTVRMIHAYLFIAGGRHVRGDDPSGHGHGFCSLQSLQNYILAY